MLILRGTVVLAGLLAFGAFAAAPTLLKEINPTTSSGPSGYVNINGVLLFSADDGVSGTELWKTDGTTAGTVRVLDIRPGLPSSVPRRMFVFNNLAIFIADDGLTGNELWRSDGTPGGTFRLTDLDPGTDSTFDVTGAVVFNNDQFAIMNGFVYFAASDGVNGRQLYRTDGTNTTLVKAFNTLAPNIGGLCSLGNVLVFVASDGAPNGPQLFRSDGTSAGTVPITTINPGSTGFIVSNIINVNGVALFGGSDGVSGLELWRSDGTAAGTSLLKDINPGDQPSSPSLMYVSNGKLFFQSNGGPDAGLWISDGTAAGTNLVKKPLAVTLSNNGPYPTIGNNFFFVGNDGVAGTQLWKSDGTTAGTMMVKDILSFGTGGAVFGHFAVCGGDLFFNANDELWRSDGTELSTVSTQVPGPSPKYFPSRMTNLNGSLIFNAQSVTENNTEPLIYVPPPSANKPTITSASAVSGSVGTALNFTITAANSPNRFTATGLAPGLSLNATSGVLSGTPSMNGTFSATITTKNEVGGFQGALTITIGSGGPAITSATTAAGRVGSTFNYMITATGSPTSFAASGLPQGLSINTVTGLISGTPTAAGSSTVTLTATNATGNGTANLTLTIGAVVPGAPSFTSAATASAIVGTAFSYAITATGSPTSFDATGLPDGLTVNSSSGLISGTPTAIGISNVTLTAANNLGSTSSTLLISVSTSGGGGGGGGSGSLTDSDSDGYSDELEDFLGSSPTNAASTPLGAAPGEPERLSLLKIKITLKFSSPGKDGITASGTLPVFEEYEPEGDTVVVDVGGVIQEFFLNAKGAGSAGLADKFKLKIKRKAGLVVENPIAKYSVKLAKGDFATALSDEGLLNDVFKNEPVSVPVTIIFAMQNFRSDKQLLYTAKPEKSGKTKLP